MKAIVSLFMISAFSLSAMAATEFDKKLVEFRARQDVHEAIKKEQKIAARKKITSEVPDVARTLFQALKQEAGLAVIESTFLLRNGRFVIETYEGYMCAGSAIRTNYADILCYSADGKEASAAICFVRETSNHLECEVRP